MTPRYSIHIQVIIAGIFLIYGYIKDNMAYMGDTIQCGSRFLVFVYEEWLTAIQKRGLLG
jgi:hypothetical protein